MREYKHISSEERSKLYLGLAQGIALAEIARQLGRSKATIYREIKRNKTSGVGYLPDSAHKYARQRKYRGFLKLEKNPELAALIIRLMREDKWSPAAIAGRILDEKHTNTVCAETIYQYIYLSDVGRRFQLFQLLPRQKPRRQKQRGRKSRIKILGRVSIHKRPQIEGMGHFEADLIMFGKSGKNLTSAIDIKSKYLTLKLNTSKRSKSIINNLEKTMRNNNLAAKSITFDNGLEFAQHNLLVNKGIKTYFCDPYSSWQKGLVEQANGLVRRFLPKNFNQNTLNDNMVEKVQNIINLRPRKSLGFKTPFEVQFNTNLTLTHRRTWN
jgi:IS30 family transposase